MKTKLRISKLVFWNKVQQGCKILVTVQIMKTGIKSKNKDISSDSLSTSIIEDLLSGTSDWKSTDDIVKLTLKAITDVLKIQCQSMRQIKSTLSTRCSKSELSTGLSMKANTSDVSRTVAELSNSVDSKLSINEFHTAMRDYVTRYDVQQISMNKVSAEDIKQMLIRQPDERAGSMLLSRFEEMQKDIGKKLAGFVTVGEFRELLNLVDQKANTSQINEVLEMKVSKQTLASTLQKKLARNDVELMLSKKADISDLEYIVNNLETKADLSTIEKLTQVIENKCDKSDINLLMSAMSEKSDKGELQLIVQAIEEVKGQFDKKLNLLELKMHDNEDAQTFKRSLSSLKESMTHLLSQPQPKQVDVMPSLNSLKYELLDDITKVKEWAKILNEESTRRIKDLLDQQTRNVKQLLTDVAHWQRKQEKIYKQIDEVRRRAEQINGRCLDKKDFIQFKSQTVTSMDEKLQSHQVQLALNKLESSISAKLANDKQDTLSIVNTIQKSLSNSIAETSSELVRFTALLAKKQDRQDTLGVEQSSRKNSRKELDEFRRAMDRIIGELQTKLNVGEYENDLMEIRKRFEALQKEMATKANIKDVCVLVDSKPNVQEVNKALKQLHQQLDNTVSESDLKSVIQEQATINQTLCSENIVGRWLWHSGQTKTGSLVPWQSQSINTLPDNFLWDKDKTSILSLASGMYELVVCFFCRSKPVITVLVNGELLTTKGTAAIEEGVRKRKQKDMVGVKLIEYVMLPARARISVAFSGQHGSQGFLNIRRL